jgi:hypothetical protein
VFAKADHGGASNGVTKADSESSGIHFVPHEVTIPGMYTRTTIRDVARFELKEGPKLEEWIPEQYLPEVLVVYDPDCVAYGTDRSQMKIYKRTHPPPASTRESKEGNAGYDG